MKVRLIIFILACSISLGAQTKYKFKKITNEMLEQEVHSIEEEADAAFLYNGYDGAFKYYENDGFVFEYTVYQRIKVYKESGKDWGDFSILLYKSSNDEEEILDIDAYTYNLQNGKKVEQKVDRGDIYEEEVNEYYTTTKFALPNVQEGSVLEVRYKVKSPFTFRISEFYFQKSIPVDHAMFEIGIPEYFGYSPLMKGLVAVKTDVNSKTDYISYKTKEAANVRTGRNVQTQKIEYKVNINYYFAENIPSLRNEDYVHNMDNYRSSIAHELQFTKYPNSEMKRYSNSWDNVAKVLATESKFGKELSALTKQADEILANISGETDSDKARQIYEYIGTNYKWNGKNRLLGSGGKKVLKEHKGNSADINLLLVATLRKAGLDAYPIVSKTRSEGYLNISFPVIADLNYVFVLLETEEGPVYLDATSPGLPFGFLPPRADNLNGVVITEDSGIKRDIANPNKSKKVEYIKLQLSKDSLIGTKTLKYGELSDFYARQGVKSMEDKKEYISSINRAHPETHVTNCEFKNIDNPSRDLVCTQNIDYSTYLQGVEDKVFIPVSLDQGYEENPFRDEVRNFNVFFNSTTDYKSTIIVSIPEGYKVESMPESIAFSLPGRSMSFSITTTLVNEGYVVNLVLKRNVTSMSAESYLDLRRFYDEIVKVTKESVVIQKS